LGLAIVQEVAAVHGAALSIDHGPGGVGTTVQILFAYAKPRPGDAPPHAVENAAVGEPPLAAAAAPPLSR
jgi:hypothetical protein